MKLQESAAMHAKTLQKPTMKCRQTERSDPQAELFKVELTRFIDPQHAMVKLADRIDWNAYEESFAAMWCDDNGRPAIDTRLMVSLHYLKYTYDLSDESVCESWLQNPYWQYLSGMRYFQHEAPLDPSSMSRWRGRAGEAGMQELLQQTIRTGLDTNAIKPTQLQRVNIDTTVQEKHVRFPTDSRLYDRAREVLVKAAKTQNIPLRQTYSRKGKHLLAQQSRYAHARQYKRAAACTRKLRTLLGRTLRDIKRQLHRVPPESVLHSLLERAQRIHDQQRHDKKKLYSMHAPEVECISKGKAHKKYEFGVKVSIATTSKGGWHLAALACPGNPYDGHTLAATVDQLLSNLGDQAPKPRHIFTDQGYRGHDYQGDITVHVDKKRRGNTAKTLWKWMKRRSAIEPGIGHLKAEHRMERNRLRGPQGDRNNALLSAAGMNFAKLLKHMAKLWREFLLAEIRGIPPNETPQTFFHLLHAA